MISQCDVENFNRQHQDPQSNNILSEKFRKMKKNKISMLFEDVNIWQATD